jgi:hypothetical protein
MIHYSRLYTSKLNRTMLHRVQPDARSRVLLGVPPPDALFPALFPSHRPSMFQT